MANQDLSGINVIVKATPSCEVCDKPTTSGAKCYCLQCGVYLCDGCLKVHAKLPTTKQHTYAVSAPVSATSTAASSTGATASPPPSTSSSPHTGSGAYSLCLTHDVRQRYYCRRCHQALCGECLVEEHRDHETVQIEVQVEAVRQRLDEEQAGIERLLTEEEQRHKDFNQVLQDFNKHEKRIRNLLESEKREEMKRIEMKFQAVEDENESRAKTFTASMRRDIKTLESRIVDLKDAIQRIVNLKTHVTGSCRSDTVDVTTPDVSGSVQITAAPRPELIDNVESRATSCGSQTEPQGTSCSTQTGVVERSSSTQRDLNPALDAAVAVSRAQPRDLNPPLDAAVPVPRRQPRDLNPPLDAAVPVPRRQTRDSCSKNGLLTFRRRVSDIEVGERYYGDEITINHVPWSISVQRDGGWLAVWVEADRHESLPPRWQVSAELTTVVVHPTDTSKNQTQNESHKFTRGSRLRWVSGWMFEEHVVAGGLIDDGYLTAEVRVETTGAERLPPCSRCGH